MNGFTHNSYIVFELEHNLCASNFKIVL